MKEFKEFTIQSTVSNSVHSDSEELVDAVNNSYGLVDAVSDPKSDPLVATHTSDINSATDTTNVNSPHKLLANKDIPSVIQGVIPPVHRETEIWFSTRGGDLHAVHKVLLEEIGTGADPSAARVFKDPPVINCKVARRPIPMDMNTYGVSLRVTTQVQPDTGTSAPPFLISSQEIGSPRGSIVTQKVRNSHPFTTSIHQFSPKHGHPTPIFSKVIGRKIVSNESADVNYFCEMYFRHNSVVSESQNFMDFGLSPANTPDKLKSVIVPTTRDGSLTN